mmetsp:Transcript_37098/g.93082  ORF Transcript_37098/g.93082 Transcript_37098/m.93082 type:complete len:207 (+) Transcript_37098:2933-3553(+)
MGTAGRTHCVDLPNAPLAVLGVGHLDDTEYRRGPVRLHEILGPRPQHAHHGQPHHLNRFLGRLHHPRVSHIRTRDGAHQESQGERDAGVDGQRHFPRRHLDLPRHRPHRHSRLVHIRRLLQNDDTRAVFRLPARPDHLAGHPDVLWPPGQPRDHSQGRAHLAQHSGRSRQRGLPGRGRQQQLLPHRRQPSVAHRGKPHRQQHRQGV